MKLRTGGLGLEAIKVQRKDVLFLGLVGKINELRKGSVNASTLTKSGIADLIEKATQLNVNLKLTPINWCAFVGVPQLDKNHPLLGKFKNDFSDEDALKLLSKGSDIIKGWVDLEEGKVHGDFRKVECTITIAENMFVTDKMSDEELAAVIMHEVGHLFSYFEMLGTTVTTNYAINTAVTALFSPDRKVDKVEIVDAYSKLRDVTYEEKQKLLTMNSKEGVATVMLQAEIQKSVSESGASMYDATGFEFLSDQFATRHGGGMALVTALDKLQRYNRDPVYRNAAVFYSVEMLKAVGFFTAITFGGPATWLMGILIMSNNPHESTYDLPRDRIERIKRDLVEQLKDRKLDDDTRQALTDDVEAIEAIMSTMTQRTGIAQLVWEVLSPTTRKQLRQKDAQRQIEKLLTNDMFVTAAKFKNLGAG